MNVVRMGGVGGVKRWGCGVEVVAVNESPAIAPTLAGVSPQHAAGLSQR